MFKATKCRLYPTADQRTALAFQFGAMRWVYNNALHWRKTAWTERGESISKRQTLDNLVALKSTIKTRWLKEADSQALQQSVMHLDDAFKRFFRKQGRFPRFKNKYGKQAMSYPQRVKIIEDNKPDPKMGRMYLPKVGNVKVKLHRAIVGKIKTVTVSRTQTGKYYASILCDDGLDAPALLKTVAAEAVIGIDLGIIDLVTTSTGEKHKNPRFLKRATANLRRKQKTFSRKQKGSANRNKARLLLAKAHEKPTNQRNDFQHKVSKYVIDKNQAICVETLRVKNMLKNRNLAKHISDAAWGDLLRKLIYKAARAGKPLVKIDPWFPSSKTCSGCGVKVDTLALSVRHWTCKHCNQEHDRDINAAINIRQQGILILKTEGLSVSACGGLRKTDTSVAAVDARSSVL